MYGQYLRNIIMPLLVFKQFLQQLPAPDLIKFHPRLGTYLQGGYKSERKLVFLAAGTGPGILITQIGERGCQMIGARVGRALEISGRQLFSIRCSSVLRLCMDGIC